ncbi:MAG: sulfur carrier protein ThiS adenylyltransferase ThiF [Candidatus Omnitrophica bacterium]|nr:sulfur carrier protein ThiS adenylyltransferase ThiF [Candidatus Omnitrophota bacterium]
MNTFEQGLLTYLTKEQLATIQSKRIGIGGAGGLGSNCAMILVRTGFKHIELLDMDVIDASNLNRQQYFLEEIGKPKVEITRRRLLDINPDLNITVHQVQWTTDNANQFFQNADFIVEAFDKADFKHQFVDYYQDKFPYIISGIGMAGLTQKQPLKLRRLGNVIIAGDTQTDSAQGHPPMAPRVTMCAAMMAEAVLDITLNIPVTKN